MHAEKQLNLEWLEKQYGALMHAHDVQKVLRYPSSAAFRMARMRGKINLPMFSIPGRKGLFAYTANVALAIEQLIPQQEIQPM
jgi:hypothetical protein